MSRSIPAKRTFEFVMLMFLLVVSLSIFSVVAFADGWLPDNGDRGFVTSAPNVFTEEPSADGLRVGGIANTRHNLTMSYNANAETMDQFRNNYYEICVYCHTPHGANSTTAAPLWNRTVTQRTYTLYNNTRQSSLDLNYTQPGPNSLTCLSCHDGATAIDSVINMPTQMTGAFRAGYSSGQQTNVDSGFLDAWGGNQLGAGSPADTGAVHNALGGGVGCLACHNPRDAGNLGSPDFNLFVIGTNLANDHPIGVEYPKEFGDNVDFNEPDIKAPKMAFFDSNSNGYADPQEVRLYNTGDGYEVECGSCHDPHGIKIAGENNDELIPSFLRVGAINSDVTGGTLSDRRALVSGNEGSSLCLTCHVK